MKVIVAACLTALFATNVLLTVSAIGKPREPINDKVAIGTMVLAALLIWAIWWLAG